ncbi:DUF3119 family protein [Leptolyngbya sp. CCNP1308]|uniref:DUF3119 family protein n=1 Tax=Leptolyngbya sp. CCNP1308 TaxID=3110255 RepID=UPI002B21BF4F|nr:DUF3119 family protein [Leptolyngbya sp. CCNP1308]MEA5450927.1 DUF3119 family protein [Leptolyngbya sp. CCNP1308]
MTSSTTATYTDLPRSYRIPLVVMGLGLLLAFGNIWLGALVGLFGLFLLVQTRMLRLRFTDSALDIYRGDTLIRHFPYAEWQHWEIFWEPVPVLFYFREVNSIHFLPIIFGSSELRTCLETHCATAQEEE